MFCKYVSLSLYIVSISISIKLAYLLSNMFFMFLLQIRERRWIFRYVIYHILLPHALRIIHKKDVKVAKLTHH